MSALRPEFKQQVVRYSKYLEHIAEEHATIVSEVVKSGLALSFIEWRTKQGKQESYEAKKLRKVEEFFFKQFQNPIRERVKLAVISELATTLRLYAVDKEQSEREIEEFLLEQERSSGGFGAWS